MITRRSYNRRCRYWKVDSRNRDYQNLVRDKVASGIFYAKQVDNIHRTDQNESGVVEFEVQTFTIETQDNVNNIDHKDIVEFNGKLYMVVDISSQEQTRTTEYSIRPDKKTWITLMNRG